jgi:acyl-CoA synthetase (AMP-forming)/AMP-acid ligase II
MHALGADASFNQGDRVMVQLPRVNEFWVQLFGLMRIGAVPCPGTTLLMAKGEGHAGPPQSGSHDFNGDVSSARTEWRSFL